LKDHSEVELMLEAATHYADTPSVFNEQALV